MGKPFLKVINSNVKNTYVKMLSYIDAPTSSVVFHFWIRSWSWKSDKFCIFKDYYLIMGSLELCLCRVHLSGNQED